MITYNPAFDLYHCIYRMAHIAQKLDDGESFEIDKVRIWDFYLLFPSKLFDVTIRLPETDIRDARNQYVKRIKNPYEYSGDNRKLFEWIKPFQLSALNCLVSYGILSKDDYLDDRVSVANRMTLDTFIEKAGCISPREQNVLSFLSIFSRKMPLTGVDGLKARTKLLEFKYDAE